MNLADILQDPETRREYANLPADYRAAWEWRAKWLMTAHKYQIPPTGEWWEIGRAHV